MPISALILVKNEEKMIEDCLKQLKFAKEIIVLDQHSQDKTVKIAKKFTNKIFASNFESFAVNRNFLADKAKSSWLLYVDADERLTPEAVAEIKAAITQKKFSGFYFPRKNIILGKWLKHGGWWPDYVPRLFLKKQFLNWQGKIHESPQIKGEWGYLKTPIVHLTASSLKKMLAKTVKWAKIEAQLYFEQNAPQVTIAKVAKSILTEFSTRFFVKRGFLDGTVGLIEAIFQSLHQAIIQVYLWELQNGTQEKFKKLGS